MPVRSPDVLHRRFLRDDVVTRLRDAIVTGALRPGEGLSERALVAGLGVSPMTLRHALQVLASTGLVELRPNRSPIVTAPEHADAPGALVTLGVLVRGVARLAIPSMSDADRADHLRGIARTTALCEAADVDALRVDTLDGYHRWADSCPNPFLAATLRSRADALAYTLVATGSVVSQSVVLSSLHGLHRAVQHADTAGAMQSIARMHSAEDVESDSRMRDLRPVADAA